MSRSTFWLWEDFIYFTWSISLINSGAWLKQMDDGARLSFINLLPYARHC